MPNQGPSQFCSTLRSTHTSKGPNVHTPCSTVAPFSDLCGYMPLPGQNMNRHCQFMCSPILLQRRNYTRKDFMKGHWREWFGTVTKDLPPGSRIHAVDRPHALSKVLKTNRKNPLTL